MNRLRGSRLGILLILTVMSACDTSSSGCTSPKRSPVKAPSKASKTPDPPAMLPKIDAHTHIGPNAYGTFLSLGKEHNIVRFVNLSGGHFGRKRGIQPHLDAMKAHPGRVAVMYNLDWKNFHEEGFGERSARDLERAVKAGYAGLKIPKVLGLGLPNRARDAYEPVDTEVLDPVWAKAGELGVPVAIHTGDPKAFFEPVTPQNERYEELSAAPSWSFADASYPRREVLLKQREEVLKRHPKTTFILVHFGNNPEDIDDVARILDTYPNVYLDTSARIAEIGRHDPKKVLAMFEKYQDRILFGTDAGVNFRKTRRGPQLGLFLGSISKEPPGRRDAKIFFDRHWAFFESDPVKTGPILHPVPIQGDWMVKPIDLPRDILQKVYVSNTYKLIFEPMFRRQGVTDPLKAAFP